MKKFINAVKHTPMLLALIFILLFFFPSAITSPPESVSNPIVTAVGIDRNDEKQFEVTLLTFLSYPNQSYAESYEVYTCTGENLSEALTKAALQIGKSVSLFHVHTAVVSEKLLEEDITPALDYLVRVESLPQSCLLLATNVKTKEFIEFIKELNSQSDINLEELSFYNSNYISWEDTTIDAYLQDYYSPCRSFMMSYFPLVEGDINGIPLESSSSGGGGGSQSGGGASSGGEGSEKGSAQSGSKSASQGGEKELVNDGSELIIKDGKKVSILTRELLRGVNWFNPKTIGAELVLTDFTDENFSNAELVYRVNRKQIITNLEYENGVPIYNANLKLYVSLVEMNSNKDDLKKKHKDSYVSEKVREEIEENVKQDIMLVLEKLKSENVDILQIYDSFYRWKRNETKKIMKNLNDPSDFLKEVVFRFNVSIYPN